MYSDMHNSVTCTSVLHILNKTFSSMYNNKCQHVSYKLCQKLISPMWFQMIMMMEEYIIQLLLLDQKTKI